jgi:uncharacterized protein
MIKKDPITSHIAERLPQLEAYLSGRHDVAFAYLFGSFASGNARPLSDVDIAVYLDGSNISEKRLELLGHLANILKTDEIDLVILNSAPLTLKMKILQSRCVVSDNQPFRRHLYESITIRGYLDFSILEMRLLERRFLNG